MKPRPGGIWQRPGQGRWPRLPRLVHASLLRDYATSRAYLADCSDLLGPSSHAVTPYCYAIMDAESYWARWHRRVGGASTKSELIAALLESASEAGRAVSSSRIRWAQIGVEVRTTRLRGRLGGIVQSTGHRIAMVDPSLDPRQADYVVAHEIGHMVLGRADAIQSAEDEEQLCDLFAASMLRAAGRSPERVPA